MDLLTIFATSLMRNFFPFNVITPVIIYQKHLRAKKYNNSIFSHSDTYR